MLIVDLWLVLTSVCLLVSEIVTPILSSTEEVVFREFYKVRLSLIHI